MMRKTSLLALTMLLFGGCAPLADATVETVPSYDVIIRNGTVYDGTGSEGKLSDLAVSGDRIVKIGPRFPGKGKTEIDATGMAVTPGFINMLSWATTSLIADGRSLSDIKQGVTLEVFGEGWSMGPLNEEMKEQELADMGELKYDIDWTTLGEYLESLQRRGVSTNVASFLGATTLRIHEIGFEDRSPTAKELKKTVGHGMEKKLLASIESLEMGVKEVIISSGDIKNPISSILKENEGTVITND